MGTVAKYECRDCGHTFKASCGGGFCFVELRCEKCDNTQRLANQDYPIRHYLLEATSDVPPVPEGERAAYLEQLRNSIEAHNNEVESRFKCESCGGQMKTGLGPMCPLCHSRQLTQLKVSLYFD